MRKTLLFALFLVPAFAGASWADTPAFIDEANFPTFSRPLTPAEQAHLGLSARILREPLEVLNRRGPSDYRFDRLEPGDVVLEDQSGTPRYKASCGNRIEALPVKVTVIGPTPPAPRVAETPPSDGKGIDWAGFFRILGAFLLTALLLAGAVAVLLWAFKQSRRRTSPPTPGPAPTVVPAVTPALVSPAPSVTPTPVPVPGTVPPAPAATPSSLTRHTHPMYLWTVRNGSVEWDTALVAATIESGFGPDGNATLEIRLTARPPVPTP